MLNLIAITHLKSYFNVSHIDLCESQSYITIDNIILYFDTLYVNSLVVDIEVKKCRLSFFFVISVNKIRNMYITCCCFFDLGSKECIMLNNEHTVCLETCFF